MHHREASPCLVSLSGNSAGPRLTALVGRVWGGWRSAARLSKERDRAEAGERADGQLRWLGA